MHIANSTDGTEGVDGDVAENVGDWLDTRLASVEAEFAGQVRRAVPLAVRRVATAEGPEALAALAAASLSVLLASGCETRASAPDLLVVDSLVTYACEMLAVTGASEAAGGGRDRGNPAERAEAILLGIAAVLPGPQPAPDAAA